MSKLEVASNWEFFVDVGRSRRKSTIDFHRIVFIKSIIIREVDFDKRYKTQVAIVSLIISC